MKISKEDFNKLSQLDRIEFRQRQTEIDKLKTGLSNTLYSTYLIVAYFVIVIICNILVLLSKSGEFLMPTMWIIIILPIAYLADIFNMFNYIKNSRKLEEEYFKFEVKKK